MTVLAPTLPLLHGAAMPRLGLGTWPMNDSEVQRALVTAIELGYRLVDTAEALRQRARCRARAALLRARRARSCSSPRSSTGSGTAEPWSVRRSTAASSGSARTTSTSCSSTGRTRATTATSRPGKGSSTLLESGRVRAIGTSNFKPSHLERIIAATGVVPDVNQIELSPLLTRDATRAFDAAHGIVTESWSPIGGAGTDVLRHPVVIGVGGDVRPDAGPGRPPLAHGARPRDRAQVRRPGADAAEPRTIFDFTLSPDGRRRPVSALDQGESAATDSDRSGH